MHPAPAPRPLKPLRGIRILSLALNIPGPMALVRLAAMGARCTKIEPPAGDPMRLYNAAAYADMHTRVKVLQADLRTESGQKLLERQLARADVLLTSFRPSGLAKLGLGWKPLPKRHPALCQLAGVATSNLKSMFAQTAHDAVARCFASRSCAELDALGQSRDIPIHTLKDASP